MNRSHWQMIGALAAVVTLWLTWKRAPLQSSPLSYSPFDPATSDLSSYGPQSADSANVTAIRATDMNSPTYAGWREPGIVSTFLGGITRRTWGVKDGPVQAPSLTLPVVGIVPGQTPLNRDLLYQGPSVSPDPDQTPLADVAMYNDDLA